MKNSFAKKKINIFWVIVLSIFLLIFLIISLTSWGVFGEMPSIDDLQNPSAIVSSEVFSEDGVMIGKFYQKDKIHVKYEDISPYVVKALIATEDERFYDHSGIDIRALLRALVGVLTLSPKGGASTITQQLALNMLSDIDASNHRAKGTFKRINQKIKEWIIAVKLERHFSKEEILALYLNSVPFGENLYGIKNASKTYFQKAPLDLELEEAAVLVGMLKGNTIYNPKRNPKAAIQRRNTVIEQMYKNDFITGAMAIGSKSKPMTIRYLKLDEQSGMATHFREIVRDDVRKMLKTIKKPNGDSYDIYKDGIRVYTTIDSRMQQFAEQAVNTHLPIMQNLLNSQTNIQNKKIWDAQPTVLQGLIKQTERYKGLVEAGWDEQQIKDAFGKKISMKVFDWNVYREKDTVLSPLDSLKLMHQFLQTGFMAMDVKNGHVKAWVGGINYKYFKYDHVNTNTKRQVGSSIKPLLYALAIMDLGYNYNTLCPNVSQCFPEYENWCSHNTDYDSSDYVPLWRGLALSLNNVSAYLIRQVTPKRFVEFLQNTNISSNLYAVPSLSLGTMEISLFEMIWAYSMFPGRGFTVKPIYITRIEDRNGNILKSFGTEKKNVIGESDAYLMSQLMKNVVDFGTAASMRYKYNVRGDVAGKTGTTNDNSDAWFIGYTPNLVAGVWVGCDQRFISLTSNMGFGGKAAMPVFASFVKNVYETPGLIKDSTKHFLMPQNYETTIQKNNINNNEIKHKKTDKDKEDYNDLYFK